MCAGQKELGSPAGAGIAVKVRGCRTWRGGVPGAEDLRRASALCYKQHMREQARTKLCE